MQLYLFYLHMIAFLDNIQQNHIYDKHYSIKKGPRGGLYIQDYRILS